MAQLVSKAYSDALFEVGLEMNNVQVLLDEFTFIMETFDEYKDFYELFKTPRISAGEKKGIIEETFKDKISAEMLNFLKILLDKSRAIYFDKIYREFINLTNEYFKVEEAIVHSISPLTETQINEVKAKLEAVTGKEIEIKNVVNEEILGGLLIKVGDKVLDGTVKRKLHDIKDSLAQIILD